MTYEALIRIIEPRCRRLGIPQDAYELLSLTYQMLQEIADHQDFDAFTTYSAAICSTQASVPNYPLPDTFGRQLHPTDDRQGSLVLWDGLTEAGLAYRPPIDFHHQASTTNGKPSHFTLRERELWLDPPPDSNGGADYVVRGTFIAAIAYPRMDDVIPLDEPSALVDAVLAEATLDAGLVQAQAFAQKKLMSMNILAGSQAKMRAQFSRARGERSWRR